MWFGITLEHSLITVLGVFTHYDSGVEVDNLSASAQISVCVSVFGMLEAEAVPNIIHDNVNPGVYLPLNSLLNKQNGGPICIERVANPFVRCFFREILNELCRVLFAFVDTFLITLVMEFVAGQYTVSLGFGVVDELHGAQ